MAGDYVFRNFVIEDLDKKSIEEHQNINAMCAFEHICNKYKLNQRNHTIKDEAKANFNIDIRFVIHQICDNVCTKSWYVVPVRKEA